MPRGVNTRYRMPGVGVLAGNFNQKGGQRFANKPKKQKPKKDIKKIGKEGEDDEEDEETEKKTILKDDDKEEKKANG